MKAKSFPLTLILLAATLFLQPACEKVKKNDSNYQQVESYLKSDTWSVTSFNHDGSDEVNFFNGYRFTFNDDGYVRATDGCFVNAGTWKLTPAVGSSSTLILTLVFQSDEHFQQLTKDWDVISFTNAKISFAEHSSSAVHVDKLIIQK